MDYSRFQFIVSFLLVVAWFYFILNLERGARRSKLFLLPYGDGMNLIGSGDVEWTVAAVPQQLAAARKHSVEGTHIGATLGKFASGTAAGHDWSSR